MRHPWAGAGWLFADAGNARNRRSNFADRAIGVGPLCAVNPILWRALRSFPRRPSKARFPLKRDVPAAIRNVRFTVDSSRPQCVDSRRRSNVSNATELPSIEPGREGSTASVKAAVTGVRSWRLHPVDALKMYRLVLKKYLPASLRRSNSLFHSFRSSAETSFLRPTKSRIPFASPWL
jgi:hypothetical protein